jgi:hypothetical protein
VTLGRNHRLNHFIPLQIKFWAQAPFPRLKSAYDRELKSRCSKASTLGISTLQHLIPLNGRMGEVLNKGKDQWSSLIRDQRLTQTPRSGLQSIPHHYTSKPLNSRMEEFPKISRNRWFKTSPEIYNSDSFKTLGFMDFQISIP